MSARTSLATRVKPSLADCAVRMNVGRDIHFCMGGGQIVYLIMAMNVVFLESEFEVYVLCNGVSLCLDYNS